MVSYFFFLIYYFFFFFFFFQAEDGIRDYKVTGVQTCALPIYLAPRVIGRFLAIAWPIVGMEAVRRARIDLEFGGLAGGLEGRFHLLDLIDRNALIFRTIEAEHRLLDLLGGSDSVDRHRFARRVGETAVEGDAGLEVAVGGIAPHGTAAAAEAHDAEPVGVAALRLCPRDRGVEIGKQLGVRLGVHDREQRRHFGDLGQVALAEIIVG